MDPDDEQDDGYKNPYEDDESPESRRADDILRESRESDREDLQGWNQRADAAKKAHEGDGDVDAAREGEKAARSGDTDGAAAGGGSGGAPKPKDDGDVKKEEENGGWLDRTSDKSESKLKNLFKKKKSFIAAGLITSMLGGGIAGFTIISGPFEFIHFAHLLHGLHLQDGEDKSDDRIGKIARYIRTPSMPENTRMGALGNKYANRIEARFNRIGIQSSYTDLFGFHNGYVVDVDNLSGDLERMKGKPDAEVKEFFKREYGIDLVGRDKAPWIKEGQLFASADGMGYFKNRALIRTMVRTTGTGGLFGAIHTRVMGKRAGIDWHPIRKLDRALLKSVDDRYTAWRARRAATIENGAGNDTVVTSNNTDPDEDKQASQNADDAEQSTKNINEEAQAANKEATSGQTAETSKFKTKLTLSIAGGALAITGILCALEFYSANYDVIAQANVTYPLMRIGMSAVTMGYQVESGKGVDLEQMEFMSKQFYDAETKTTPFDARSIQAGYGQSQTGPPDPSEARIDPNGNFLTQLLDKFPGLDTICKAEGSAAGQVILFGVSFIGGPISTIVGTGAALILNQYIPEILGWLAGHPIGAFPAGAKYGAYADYGTFYAANDAAASSGGYPLTPEQTAQLNSFTEEDNREDMRSKSLAYRLFNPYDYRTLTGSLLMSAEGTGADRSVGAMRQNVANILRVPGKTLGALFMGRASAAGAYNYGVPKIGTSVSDMNNPMFENPFTNADIAFNQVLKGPKAEEYIERAKTCSGMVINMNGTVTFQGSPTIKDMVSPDNKCAENNNDWKRVQFYVNDTGDMESAACYYGDAEACNNVGFPTGAAPPGTASPEGMAPWSGLANFGSAY